MRADFYDSSFAASFAIGDFFTSDTNLEILMTAMTRHDHDTAWGFTWKLYLYKPNFTTRELSKMDEITVCTRMVPKEGSAGGNGAGVNSPLSVGNLHGSSGILEVVFSTGKAFGDNDAGDTLVVYQLNTATGEFVQGRKAWYPVKFARYTKVSGSPAIGKLDTVAGDDIAFATDDNLYLLRMTADTGGMLTSIHAGESVPFGNVPNNRLFDDDPLPQPLIARVDTAGECDVLVNHWGDGMIWAFGVASNMTVKRKPGFPLRTNSRISQAPVVADLEGDGILDLVAVDDGGYAYAWNLAPGSVYNQPWPSARGNEWNSAFTGYKPLGPNGYVREDWVTEKIAPYAWVETGINNALSAPETAGFERQPDSMQLNNISSSYRNYHLTGPKLAGLSNYTISGAMMRGSDTTQMGVNLYSEWPDSARKYELSVQGNGTLNVKYYNNGYQTVGSYSALQAQAGQWFKYKAKVSTVGGTNIFGVKWWQTDETEPDSFQISASHSSATNSGTVGTFAGVGTGSWSPILVSSGHTMSGSIIANEDFEVDSLVDVKPFIPANWHPDYSSIRLYLGTDTTGFVLDTTGPGASLAYRHKEGINYPATCRLIAPTNLEYRNYEFTGQIVKPAGAVYDSIGVGVIVYSQGNKWYALKTNGKRNPGDNGYFLLTRDSIQSNGSLHETVLYTLNGSYPEFIGANDTIDFSLSVSTTNVMTILKAKVKTPNGAAVPVLTYSDSTELRIENGESGILLNNYYGTSLMQHNEMLPVRYNSLLIQKN